MRCKNSSTQNMREIRTLIIKINKLCYSQISYNLLRKTFYSAIFQFRDEQSFSQWVIITSQLS